MMIWPSHFNEVFRNSDPRSVSAYINRNVNHHELHAPSECYPTARLTHSKFGSMDICLINYGNSVRIISAPLENDYHLQLIIKGQCFWRDDMVKGELSPGDGLLINPNDPIDLCYSHDCEKLIIKIPIALMDSVCHDQRWQLPKKGVRFLNYRFCPDQAMLTMEVLALICKEMEADNCSHHTQAHYQHIFITKLLMEAESNLSREALTAVCTQFLHLNRYIEKNIKGAITLEDLAREGHLSTRSLYSLFERHTGYTPAHYIRRTKLQRVHANLLDPFNSVRSVTEAALEYGFCHLGRFSKMYRETFGELPSKTLMRRPS